MILQSNDKVSRRISRVQWLDLRLGVKKLDSVAKFLSEPELLLRALCIRPMGNQIVLPATILYLTYFIGLLEKARTHSEATLRTLGAADIEKRTVIDRPNGDQRIFNLRWLLFHVVEHAAAHHGQILTLKRLVQEAGIS